DARKIVIRQRRVASMAGNQDLVARSARNVTLRISQMTIFEIGIDTNFILAVLEIFHLTVRQTKSPGFLVIGSSIGYPIGPLGNREQMRFEFTQRHRLVD